MPASDQDYRKDALIDWYDRHSATYDAESFTQDDDHYGGDLYRIQLIRQLLRDLRPDTVLDVGCGTGEPMLALLRDGLRIRGFDLSPGMVERARQKLAEHGYDPD